MTLPAVTVALAILWGWLVWSPVSHPRTHLAALSGGDYRPLGAPPLEFALEDLEQLARLRPALYQAARGNSPVILGNLSSADSMRSLGDDLGRIITRDDDVLLVYLRAHAVVDDGVGYLVCRNYLPSGATAGRYRFRDVLSAISRGGAQSKVLLLDSGELVHDSRAGLLANEFPARVAEDVAALGDPSLWVLASTAPLQSAHTSRALARSVFTWIVVSGLRGAADANADRTVSLDELTRFVSADVSAWVRDATGGLAAQTPALFWSGGPGPGPAASLALVPCRRLDPAWPAAELRRWVDEQPPDEVLALARRTTPSRPGRASAAGGGKPPAPGTSGAATAPAVSSGGASPTTEPSAPANGADGVSSAAPDATPAGSGPEGSPAESAGAGAAAARGAGAPPSAAGAAPATESPAVAPGAAAPAPAATAGEAPPATAAAAGASPEAAAPDAATPPAANQSEANQPAADAGPAGAPAPPAAVATGAHGPQPATAGAAASTSPAVGGPAENAASPPAGAAPNAGGAGDSQTPAVAGSSAPGAAGAGGGATARPAPPAGPTSRQLAEKLTAAWTSRDALAEQTEAAPLLASQAPHLRREWEERLLAYEQLQAAGAAADPRQILRGLEQCLAVPRGLAPGAAAGTERNLATRLAQWLAPAPLEFQPDSLALASRLAAFQRRPLGATEAALQHGLAQVAAGGSLDQLTKTLERATAAEEHYVEVRLARQLAAQNEVDWSIRRQILEARLLAESLAAEPFSAAFCEPLLAADRVRLEAERAVLAPLSREHVRQAARRLSAAQQAYERVARGTAALASAQTLYFNLVHRAPDYLRWRYALGATGETAGPSSENLRRLLRQTATLGEVLEQPSAQSIAALGDLVVQLRELQSRVETNLQPSAIESLTAGSGTPQTAHLAAALLETALPTAAERARLWTALSASDRGSAQRFRPLLIDPGQTSPAPQTASTLDDATWAWLTRQVELELALARLAVTAQPTADVSLEALETAWGDWPRESNGQQTPAADSAARWAAVRQAGQALARFYSGLPGAIEVAVRETRDRTDPTHRPSQLARLRGAARALRLLDARDARTLAPSANPAQPLASAAWHDLLVWQAARAHGERFDGIGAESVLASATADRYRQAAGQLAGEPPLPLAADAAWRWSGADRLSLSSTAEGWIDLELTFTSATVDPTAQDVWIVLDYDPERLEVNCLSDLRVYTPAALPTEDSLATAPHELPATGWQQLVAAGPTPTAKLRSGEALPLRLSIRGRGASFDPARLLVRAAAADHAVRHVVTVELPRPKTIELAVSGRPGTFYQDPQGTTLRPLPNQKTAYALSLVNQLGAGRTVEVELLACQDAFDVALPRDGLPLAEAAGQREKFGRLTPLLKLPAVSLPAGGVPVAIPFPPPPVPPAALPMPLAKPVARGATEPTPAPPPPPPPPKGPSVPRALLLVITDRTAGEVFFHRLDVAVQRPSRYVTADVRYNPAAERLEVRVRPQSPELVAPEGVRVKLDLGTQVPPDAEMQLEARLDPGQDEAYLFASVVPDPRQVLDVTLEIDDFPRALFYRVPLVGNPRQIEPDDSRLAVRILAPEPGRAFAAPAEPIEVAFEVDAPSNAFATDEDWVEVGLDTDLDRELNDEPPLKLSADRQVAVYLDRLGPGGSLALETEVGDYRRSLPPPAVRNARIGILGRVVVGPRSAWSNEVEIILDGSGPHVDRVTAQPAGVVAIGGQIALTAEVSDDELSGVALVQAAFDAARKGEFGAAPPLPAVQGEDGRWRVTVPAAGLEPGPYTLLVRGTDRVGNAGPYHRLRVRVDTPEVANLTANPPRPVSGTVIYGTAPSAGIAVTLTAAPAAPGAAPAAPPPPAPQTVTSDARGNFTFPAVLPGVYKLAAEGVVRNKRRKAEIDLTVSPPPAPLAPVELKLP